MGVLLAPPHTAKFAENLPPPRAVGGMPLWNVWFHMGLFLMWGWYWKVVVGFPNVDVFLPLPNHDNQHITIVDTPSTHEEGKINKDFRKNKGTWKIKHNKYFLPFAINLKILNQKYSITLYATCHNLFRTQCCMQYKLPRISRHGEK